MNWMLRDGKLNDIEVNLLQNLWPQGYVVTVSHLRQKNKNIDYPTCDIRFFISEGLHAVLVKVCFAHKKRFKLDKCQWKFLDGRRKKSYITRSNFNLNFRQPTWLACGKVFFMSGQLQIPNSGQLTWVRAGSISRYTSITSTSTSVWDGLREKKKEGRLKPK